MENTFLEPALQTKEFHIPSNWISNHEFIELCNIQYSTEEVKKSFDIIERLLKKLGYGEDNDMMLHDYLHYMIRDHLILNDVPFLDEKEISSTPELFKYLGNKTPDLYIKGMHIVDIYVGSRDASEVKHKYKKHDLLKVHAITPRDIAIKFTSICNEKGNRLLPPKDIDFIQRQYAIFRAEYQYWQSCLKLKMILRNDRANIKIHTNDIENERKIWSVNREKWRLETNEYFVHVNNNKGL